jgi:hypothetical protein
MGSGFKVQGFIKTGVWLLVAGSWQLAKNHRLPASSQKQEASGENFESLTENVLAKKTDVSGEDEDEDPRIPGQRNV